MVSEFNAVIARGPYAWVRAALCASVLASMGCTPGGVTNVVTGVSFSGRSQRPDPSCDAGVADRTNCTPALLESLQFAKIGEEVNVVVQGVGRCTSVTADFGDGGTATNQGFQFASNTELRFPHTYTNWPGKKQVHVKGNGCLGEFTKELSVGIGAGGHEEFRLGFVPNTNVCNTVQYVGNPVIPQLRAGTVVRIEASGKIRYGVMEHDASGDRATATPPDYAFPNHRIYSLIYKVLRQEVQGENGPVIFRVADQGVLEVCVNDHPRNLTDNTGSIFLQISVNEPPPAP